MRYLDKLIRCFESIQNWMSVFAEERNEKNMNTDVPNIEAQKNKIENEEEISCTHTRLKIARTVVRPNLEEEPDNVGDTKIAKLNSHRVHPHYGWLFKVISGMDEGRQYLAITAEIKIGRKPENHICLKDPKVSRFHALVQVVDGQLILSDLQSTNGTMVNGVKIDKCKQLVSGDQIKVGETVIQVVAQPW